MSDCIEWQGCTDNFGYGLKRVGSKVWRIHRLAYTLEHGEIPKRLVVRHKCDNPKCYNVEHLELGTRGDNDKDRDTRGRTARGSQASSAKLTPEQVKEIRSITGKTQREIGAMFGLDHTSIGKILRGKTYVQS